jgi:copper chaperone
MFEVTFKVPSISCGHCARTIRAALSEAAGVEQVVVDIAAQQVTVAYNPVAIDETEMKAMLAAVDYPVAEGVNLRTEPIDEHCSTNSLRAAPGPEQEEELVLSATQASCSCCRN